MKKIKKTAAERLREKLISLERARDISKTPKKPFDPEEFMRLARKVRKTFSREELIRLESTLGIPE